VNFSNILKEAVGSRQLVRAIAYVVKADLQEDKNTFFEALEKIGYEVKSKDLQTFYGGAKKGDWDVGIAMDIMKMAGKLDVIVLVSGDGDFQELLEHASALGCRTEVLAFGKAASSKLKNEADLFVDMDKQPRKFAIKNRAPTSRGGRNDGGRAKQGKLQGEDKGKEGDS
ncbi:MAG: NYN domain-containing protein, partial [Candidatus Woesearchaeota archaeon]